MISGAAIDNPQLVLVPLGTAEFGGAERSLLDLAMRMRDRGYRVRIVSERELDGTAFSELAAERDLKVTWVDWAPERSRWRNFMAALGAFRDVRGAAVIHFNMSWRRGMWLIALAARLATRSAIVATMRSLPDDPGAIPRRRHLFGLLPGVQIWRLPDLVIGRVWARLAHVMVSVNGNDYPARLTAEFGFSRGSVRVIQNGISFPEQLPTLEERRVGRAALGYGDADFVVCYFGRLSREKGVHLLLEAIAPLPQRIKCLVIGTGPQEDELRSTATAADLAGRVRFLGFRKHPEQVVAHCDVVAAPSTWNEAFGRTVVEALALAVPVVASHTGGMGELFEHGVHGRYVPVNDVAALRAAIACFADDVDSCVRMGERGRQLVKARYTLERVADQYEQLYQNVAPRLGVPGRAAGSGSRPREVSG